jgi:hypothetical protein
MKKIFLTIILFLGCFSFLVFITSAKADNTGSISNVQVSYSDQNVVISWGAVTGAAHYTVTIDGQTPSSSIGTEVKFPGIANGDHTVVVTALDSSGKVIATSSAVSFTKTATGVTVNNNSTNGGAVSLKDITLPTSNYSDLNSLMLGLANWLIGICGGLAVIAVVYSGIMYITAGGDTAKAETARKNLTWAITGVVVAILAGVIVTIVNKALTG